MDVFIGIGSALAAVGALLVWYGVHTHRRLTARYAAATSSWRKTSATVMDARLVDQQDTDSEGNETTWYEPRLRYQYAVDGAPLEGNRTALGTNLRFSVFSSAQQWLLQHTPGSTIDLWYDPAKPTDSSPLLDKAGIGSAIVMVAMGVAFVLFGAVLMLHLI